MPLFVEEEEVEVEVLSKVDLWRFRVVSDTAAEAGVFRDRSTRGDTSGVLALWSLGATELVEPDDFLFPWPCFRFGKLFSASLSSPFMSTDRLDGKGGGGGPAGPDWRQN